MFESKVSKIVGKLPRSHVYLLEIIVEICEEKGQLTEISTLDLVKEYNNKANQI
jgi:hypothetical protein